MPREFEYYYAQKAAIEMKRSGGDFIGAIGAAFIHADLTNGRRLYDAFPHEFEKFHEYALEREKREAQG